MIPKIIHYCWLSNNPYPEKIQDCIDSWKLYLPDYEFMLWNFDRFPRGKSKWVDQAFDTHKYAFAADYIRLYALYYYGGIYLDCDVEVLKSFDDLLHLPYFIGQENTPSGIEAATLGFEKGNVFIKDILDDYDGKDFINIDGSFNIEPLPFIIRKGIEAYYEYNLIESPKNFLFDNNVINVLPTDWFSPKHYASRKIILTENTYSIHHFEGSWIEKNAGENEEKMSIPLDFKPKPCSRIDILKRKMIIWCKKKAINNATFANVFFSEYKKDKFSFADNRLFIYSSDYIKIAKLGIALSQCKYEFIRKEESEHKEQIHCIYPIARVKGTTIEIHVWNNKMCRIYTKEEMLSLICNT